MHGEHAINSIPFATTPAQDVLNQRIEEFVCDDSVVKNLLESCNDSIRAAWNGWEAACKFEDEDKQEYYMRIIVNVSDLVKKLRKL